MSRPVAYLAVSVGLLLSLAGCAYSIFGFERRAEWHDREERACMMRREVRATPWIQFDRGVDGRGACGILKPVRIAALGEGTVAIGPTATLNCPMTAAVERWIGGAVQPAAVAWFGAPVVSIKQISSYACRPRNNERGESLSEHAYGNALDVAAFTLADGRTVTVKADWSGPDANSRGFLREVFAAGCRGFKTALGPGVKYHNDHFHFDLAHHDKAGTSRYCRPVIDAPARRPSGGWLVAQGLDWGSTGSVSEDEDEIGELLADMPPDVAANLDDPFGLSNLSPDAYSPLD